MEGQTRALWLRSPFRCLSHTRPHLTDLSVPHTFVWTVSTLRVNHLGVPEDPSRTGSTPVFSSPQSPWIPIALVCLSLLDRMLLQVRAGLRLLCVTCSPMGPGPDMLSYVLKE